MMILAFICTEKLNVILETRLESTIENHLPLHEVDAESGRSYKHLMYLWRLEIMLEWKIGKYLYGGSYARILIYSVRTRKCYSPHHVGPLVVKYELGKLRKNKIPVPTLVVCGLLLNPFRLSVLKRAMLSRECSSAQNFEILWEDHKGSGPFLIGFRSLS